MLAQETAHLLGQASAHLAEVRDLRDQEAFIASMHGTVFRVTTAMVSAAYLSHLESSQMPVGQQLLVRRSKGYDLKDQEGREQALILLLAIVGYFRSSKAKIGLLQVFHS